MVVYKPKNMIIGNHRQVAPCDPYQFLWLTRHVSSLELRYADIEREIERCKKLPVQRHLRIAEQYIH